MNQLRSITTLALAILVLAEGTSAYYTMTQSKFEEILIRECKTDLNGGGNKKWYLETRKKWKQPQHKQFPESYIICNREPLLTGAERIDRIEEMLLREGGESHRKRTSLQDYPLLNDMDSTCVLASYPLPAAKRVSLRSCKDGQTCVIQPLLSMMKVGFGTIAAIENSVSEDFKANNDWIEIDVELSPAGVQREFQIEESLNIINVREDEKSYIDMRSTFPLTGRTIPECNSGDAATDPCNIMRNQVFVDQFSEDRATVYVFLKDNEDFDVDETIEVTKERLFYLVTGLASRPEISYVGIEDNTIESAPSAVQNISNEQERHISTSRPFAT